MQDPIGDVSSHSRSQRRAPPVPPVPPPGAWGRLDALEGPASEATRERCHALLAALGRGSYARGWLPEATEGELAACLARCCAQLWVTPTCGESAARIGLRCAHLPNVAIDVSGAARGAQGAFDLIVVCNFDVHGRAAEVIAAARALVPALAPRGELLAVHDRRQRHDRALHGDAVHHLLLEHLPLDWVDGERDPDCRVDRWMRT